MPTIYLDMDGVVADFNTAARRYLKRDQTAADQAAQAGRWPEEEWRRLRDVPNFYRHLPKMPQADMMFLIAGQFRDVLGWNLRMLTAIPKGNDVPDCIQDKVEWMQEFFPGVRVDFGPYSQDKQQHCQPGDILVDDRRDNCDQWVRAGGLAVKVDSQNYDGALAELKRLFAEYVKARA